MDSELGSCSGESVVLSRKEDADDDESMEELVTAIHCLLTLDKGSPAYDKVKLEKISKLKEARKKELKEKWEVRRQSMRMEVLERKRFREKLSTFTNKMFEEELDKVKDVKNKLALSDLSPVWREMLKKERAKFLFHKVFPVLHENCYLKTRDILKLRSTCREWLGAVDSHLVNHTWHLDFKGPWITSSRKEPPTLATDLPMSYQLSLPYAPLVYSLLGTSGVNPFISRKLILRFSNPLVGNLRYWATIGQVLRQWSDEVWHVILEFDASFDFNDLYNVILTRLTLFRNLRSVTFVCAQAMEYSLNEMQADWLRRQFKEEPLPEMCHLNFIHVTFLPRPLVQELLSRYGPQLEHISVHTLNQRLSDYGMQLTGGGSYPRLKRLELGCLTKGWRYDDLLFPVDMPCLEVMDLNFEDVDSDDIPEIFYVASKFGGMYLRELSLRMHKGRGPVTELTTDVLRKLELNMPNVEKFELTLYRINLTQLDYILPFQELKQLAVYFVDDFSGLGAANGELEGKAEKKPSFISVTMPDLPSQLIKTRDYMRQMDRSNIWEFFPDLREVKVHHVKMLQYMVPGDVAPPKMFCMEGWTSTLEKYKGWKRERNMKKRVARKKKQKQKN